MCPERAGYGCSGSGTRKRMSLTAKTGESFVAVVANHPGKNVGEEEEDAIDVPCNHAVWPHA
jgi:hypothetical protein